MGQYASSHHAAKRKTWRFEVDPPLQVTKSRCAFDRRSGMGAHTVIESQEQSAARGDHRNELKAKLSKLTGRKIYIPNSLFIRIGHLSSVVVRGNEDAKKALALC